MQDNIFDSATTGTETSEDKTTSSESSFLEKMVGEGKKFKDIEALARGKFEADNHIREITTTLDELREELARQDYAKSLLEHLDKGSDAGKESQPPLEKPSSSNTETTSQSASDLKALVEKVLTEKEKDRLYSQNVQTVTEEMERHFGDKSGQILRGKSQELGMSVEKLKEIAASSPTAFLQLIGINQSKKPTQATLPSSSVRSETFNPNSQDRDFEYYQKLRKENRSMYYTPKIQNMMIQDRERLGSRFYKT